MAKATKPAKTEDEKAAAKAKRAAADRKLFIFYSAAIDSNGAPVIDIKMVKGDKRKAFDFLLANQGTGVKMHEYKMDKRDAADLNDGDDDDNAGTDEQTLNPSA